MHDEHDVTHTRILAVPFLARGAASAGLSAYVLRDHLAWDTIIRAVAWYAIIDGIFGLVAVGLLAARGIAPRFSLLTVLTLTDAVVRVALGVTLRTVPAIAEVPMTLVPLFGAVGLASAALGIVALIVWLLAHHRYHRLHRRGIAALFDPLVTIGGLSIAVGCLLFVSPPSTSTELRDVIATAGLVLAASYAVSAVGAVMSASMPTSAPPASSRPD
jgi:hypothetical protein